MTSVVSHVDFLSRCTTMNLAVILQRPHTHVYVVSMLIVFLSRDTLKVVTTATETCCVNNKQMNTFTALRFVNI